MAPEQRERSQDVEENLELLGGHDLEGVGDVAQVLVVLQRGKEGALPVALGPVPPREPWGREGEEELLESLGCHVPVCAGHVAPVRLHLRQGEEEGLGRWLGVGHLPGGGRHGVGGLDVGPVENSPRGGLEVGDKGGELEDLGAQLQSLEDVSNGDEGLEELGESLQSLEDVADGARTLEHGGDLGELEGNE